MGGRESSGRSRAAARSGPDPQVVAVRAGHPGDRVRLDTGGPHQDLLTAPDPRFTIDKPASRLVTDWRR
jgi:hypothetical protein